MASRSRKIRTALSLVPKNRWIMNSSPYRWCGFVASMISGVGSTEERRLNLFRRLDFVGPEHLITELRDNRHVNEHTKPTSA
jgi:hypothetical protein